MRVVLDTNVLARATPGRSSPAQQLLLRLLSSDHTLIASEFLLDELGRVLRYERVRQIHGLDEAMIDKYVASIRSSSLIVVLPTKAVRVAADPDDDPILQTAIEGRAEVICTWDRHLFAAAVQSYLAHAGIRVLRDTELLNELGSEPAA